MTDGHTPGDLRWPPPSADLEPFELLEIVRDETGRDRWRRDHREPEVPETYREWLPKRLGREAAVEHDELDLFPAAEAPVTVAVPVAVAVPEPPMPVPLLFGPAATVTVPRAWRAEAAGEGRTRVDATLSAGALAKADVPALRLSLVPAPATSRPVPASAHRTFFATAERISLLAAGALMGMVVALAGIRESTSDHVGDGAGVVPVTRETAARPDSAIPAPMIPREHDAAVARVPPATVEVPLAAALPAQAAPLLVASPVPARVEPPRATTRPMAAGPPANRERPTRQPPVAPRAARVARASRPTVSEGPAVLGTVEQYATAWSRLDARATQALWPSVDRTTLVGTFTAIREQRLTLTACKATVVADHAAVTCRGTLRYRPRVGEHSTRTEQGRWTFDLARHDQAWVIASVGRP